MRTVRCQEANFPIECLRWSRKRRLANCCYLSIAAPNQTFAYWVTVVVGGAVSSFLDAIFTVERPAPIIFELRKSFLAAYAAD